MYLEIDRATYSEYEENIRDFYPAKHLEKLSQLYNIQVTDLMDDYNRFLYDGQSKRLKEIRKQQQLTQSGLAKLLNMKVTTIKNWERGSVRMYKSSWKRLKGLNFAEPK